MKSSIANAIFRNRLPKNPYKNDDTDAIDAQSPAVVQRVTTDEILRSQEELRKTIEQLNKPSLFTRTLRFGTMTTGTATILAALWYGSADNPSQEIADDWAQLHNQNPTVSEIADSAHRNLKDARRAIEGALRTGGPVTITEGTPKAEVPYPPPKPREDDLTARWKQAEPVDIEGLNGFDTRANIEIPDDADPYTNALTTVPRHLRSADDTDTSRMGPPPDPEADRKILMLEPSDKKPPASRYEAVQVDRPFDPDKDEILRLEESPTPD